MRPTSGCFCYRQPFAVELTRMTRLVETTQIELKPSATCAWWLNLPQSQDQMQSLWAFSLCKARENITICKSIRFVQCLSASESRDEMLDFEVSRIQPMIAHILPQRCNFDRATIYYLMITRLRSSSRSRLLDIKYLSPPSSLSRHTPPPPVS